MDVGGAQLHVVAFENYVTISAKYDFTSNEYLQLLFLSLSLSFMTYVYKIMYNKYI